MLNFKFLTPLCLSLQLISCQFSFDIGFIDVPTLVPTEPNYYWRPYDGIMPIDAIAGGWYLNLRPTYVAQMFVPDIGLIPGYVVHGSEQMSVIRNGKHTSKYNIKILCSPEAVRFKWVQVTNATYVNVTSNLHVPLGGAMQDNVLLKIGRVQHKGDLVIGKVTEYNLLWYTYKGSDENSVDTYQLLTYSL